MTDFHSLCYELAEDLSLWLESDQVPSKLPEEFERSLDLLKKARVQLAKPANNAEHLLAGPSLEEIGDWIAIDGRFGLFKDCGSYHDAIGLVRAAIFDWCHYGRLVPTRYTRKKEG